MKNFICFAMFRYRFNYFKARKVRDRLNRRTWYTLNKESERLFILDNNTSLCYLCEIGVPRKVIVPLIDIKTGKQTYLTMTEEFYKNHYKPLK